MNWKSILWGIGFSVLVTSWLTLFYTFFTAYSTPSKTTIVMIDKFGEADIEAFLFIGTMPLVVWVFNDILRLRVLHKRIEVLEKKVLVKQVMDDMNSPDFEKRAKSK